MPPAAARAQVWGQFCTQGGYEVGTDTAGTSKQQRARLDRNVVIEQPLKLSCFESVGGNMLECVAVAHNEHISAFVLSSL